MSTTSISSEVKTPSPWATGLALFSMFFGAGNLVFPLIIGRGAGSDSLFALGGLAISAVAFPLLGLIAMMVYKGDLHAFLARLGKWPAALLMFILYMSQGPVGSMPRLFTLMHASFQAYFPSLSLPLFSVLMAVFLFVLLRRPRQMISLLGNVLTPLLLLTLTALVIVGLWAPPTAPQMPGGALHQFEQGLKGGYQTLDLTAALLFATLLLPYLSQGLTGSPEVRAQQLRRNMMAASLVAAALLMAAYIGLCWLSSHYSWIVGLELPPEKLLHAIAVQILGPLGGCIASAAVFLACLTTALTLAAVFALYLEKEIFKGGNKPLLSMGMTLGVTVAMASLGFSGIAKLWDPILEVLYPLLIALCCWNLFHFQREEIKK